MKTFVIDGIEYTISECTAICLCDLNDESKRQDALFISYIDGENIQSVVFGYMMPKNKKEFIDMCKDYYAWESDWEVLESVSIKWRMKHV